MDMQDSRMQAVAQMQMQQDSMGYDRGYPHNRQESWKQGQECGISLSRPRIENRSNQLQSRQPRMIRNDMVEQRTNGVVRDEELAGRPAMISMNQDDVPFDLRMERSRSRRPTEEYRGNSRSGSFYGTVSSNCRSRRPGKYSSGQSRQRSATQCSSTQMAQDGTRMQVPVRNQPEGPVRSSLPVRTSNENPVRMSAPVRTSNENPVRLSVPVRTSNENPVRSSLPVRTSNETIVRTSVPVRTSFPATSSESEHVAWRVALDPKSKKPYYYHPVTRETTWKKPAELVAAETREKRHFFSVMENNIRLKLRDGYYTRDSETSTSSQSTPDTLHKPHDLSPHLSTRSCASTVSCNSTRSSFQSLTSGSTRSLPGSARQLLFHSTRSLPTTPEGMGIITLQLDTQEEEPESERRPSLFRTLSSYETPIVSFSRKGSDGMESEAHVRIIPSPIQERLRLAALEPEISELKAYTHAVKGKKQQSSSQFLSSILTHGKEERNQVTSVKSRFLRRANSTNSIYLRMGTMNTPDQDATIQCVATVLRAHMMEALDDPMPSNSRFQIFVTAQDRQRLTSITTEVDTEATTIVDLEDEEVVVPTLVDMTTFIKMVLTRAQMESECIIMSLVYVERLLKATSGILQLRGENWRRLVFCSMVMASKVWDDLSMTNADFSKIWPEVSLKEMNELELVYLSAVEYNVRVSAVSYAKYYFHLRSLCASMSLLEAFDESVPLNLEGARKMQVLSEEYQERSKLMPVPRRRSVTITSVESQERNGVDNESRKSLKASPSASLEQLVQMQVRVAGGSSGSFLKRLSSNRAFKP
ncbi:cyclin-y-like protein [Plasmopara halstedii]|uniref:Cyclin-y-like protein n=1 Tax=Plasmopara halstedii TaxID=4781 RepID=A0A0P1AH49_PLAHL|nr:cyclin-y-like protein [Plasmopara halstedii]CEG40284.1 cyclin-y-like protein [Plasmopara halstedii]|eukprot:XP_024576653.1 cyclin-y-like protein [Plasmopara halstedii]